MNLIKDSPSTLASRIASEEKATFGMCHFTERAAQCQPRARSFVTFLAKGSGHGRFTLQNPGEGQRDEQSSCLERASQKSEFSTLKINQAELMPETKKHISAWEDWQQP